MNIEKALIGRASYVLAVLVLEFGAGVVWGQTDELDAPAVKFATLHSFSADGDPLLAQLVQAINGDLYGTTWGGGGAGLFGTVFKITPSGALTTLYNFCSETGCADGQNPQGNLVQAGNGNLYGTTLGGGVSNPSCVGSQTHTCGTIFKITLSGALTTLYKFCSQSGCADGQNPVGGLIQSANGDLYGMTPAGGLNINTLYGGTIFKISPSGAFTTVYSFCAKSGCPDGGGPSGSLLQGTDGNLYGTTTFGGTYGGGSIFELDRSGKLTTLYSFGCGQNVCPNGTYPNGSLFQAASGDLYGTTYVGGANTNTYAPNGGGTIFKFTPSGQFTTVYSFCAESGCLDGEQPQAGLIQASDGSLYGTTTYGGANTNASYSGSGTIFKITPSGAFTTLHSFCVQSGCTDGFYPWAALTQSTLGYFYGTTLAGGSGLGGTVFSLSTGAPAFVETRPTIGAIGEVVTIIGYGLKGATGVTFNGTPATILYDAPTVIYAKVPAGATTGKVEVVTAKGTLTSNVAFEVAP